VTNPLLPAAVDKKSPPGIRSDGWRHFFSTDLNTLRPFDSTPVAQL
jgi:hypothetical protein